MRIYEPETRPEPRARAAADDARRGALWRPRAHGNEQNPQAVGFYEHLGFSVWKRTERAEEGGEYPLLYMRK